MNQGLPALPPLTLLPDKRSASEVSISGTLFSSASFAFLLVKGISMVLLISIDPPPCCRGARASILFRAVLRTPARTAPLGSACPSVVRTNQSSRRALLETPLRTIFSLARALSLSRSPSLLVAALAPAMSRLMFGRLSILGSDIFNNLPGMTRFASETPKIQIGAGGKAYCRE